MTGRDREGLRAFRLDQSLDQALALLQGDRGNLLGLALLLVILLGLFSAALPGTFLRFSTLRAMMFEIPNLGLLSLAMAIPLISGGLNLAIIATANQAGLLMAWILTSEMPAHAGGVTLWAWLAAALAAGFVLCTVIGLATGLIITVVNVHPVLVTLGTQLLINGISIWLTRGMPISGFPAPLLAVSNGTVLGIPISFLLFAAVAAGVHVLLTRTPLGVRIHMAGSNLEATRYSGVDTRSVLIRVYVLSSVLCWLAAIVMMAQFNTAGADIADSYLLITILAAVLGGIDPYGGFGRVIGLVISLAILQAISTGFNQLNLGTHLSLALWGVTLILVMGVKRLAAVRRTRPRDTKSSAARLAAAD